MKIRWDVPSGVQKLLHPFPPAGMHGHVQVPAGVALLMTTWNPVGSPLTATFETTVTVLPTAPGLFVAVNSNT
jgi:hypothetical protein